MQIIEQMTFHVMRSTVSSALLFTRNKELFETAYFISKVDNFSDSLMSAIILKEKSTKAISEALS